MARSGSERGRDERALLAVAVSAVEPSEDARASVEDVPMGSGMLSGCWLVRLGYGGSPSVERFLRRSVIALVHEAGRAVCLCVDGTRR